MPRGRKKKKKKKKAVRGFSSAVKQLYLSPVFAFLSQRLKWLMCFWLRPKVLMVITLLSLTLIISCLQGAITEASTSNSAELKKERKKKGKKGRTEERRWKLYSSYLMSREERNEIFAFDCFRGRQIICAHSKRICQFVNGPRLS